MAQVYKAWNTGLHRHEALKLLPPQMTFDHSFVERFLHEARTAASLRHPHIATIHTVSQPHETQPFFAMELVEGGDLADLLRQRGQLPPDEALPLLRQIAAALDYAHSHGIIHRDVKPANILLEDDGRGGWSVKVVDFGIARAQEAGDGARLTKTGMIVGTPEYMSPEQGGSGEPVDHRSDQYSLGVIAYEMLCGRPPFAVGPSGTAMTVIMSHIRDVPRAPLEQVPALPLAVNNAILKALAKNPKDRFDSCTAFVDALGGSEAVPIPLVAATPSSDAGPIPRQRTFSSRWVPFGLGSVVLLGAVMVAIGLMNSSHSPQNKEVVAPIAPSSSTPAIVPRVEPHKPTVKVPDLVGMKESQARDFVSATALQVNKVTGSNDTVPAGHVASQSPDPGTQVSPSATIRIRVSTGPGSSRSYSSISATSSPIVATPAISNDATDIVSERRLTDSDLIGKGNWDLTLMRNAVYARHGYRFHRADLISYFRAKPWYFPTIDDQNSVHRFFTPVEKYNVAFLSTYEKSHPH